MQLYVGYVQYVVWLLFASIWYFLIIGIMFLNVFVPFYVLFLLLCCLNPISVSVHRPLPPGGNPIAVNK